MSGVELVLAFVAGVVMGDVLDRFVRPAPDPTPFRQAQRVTKTPIDPANQPGTIWGREPAMMLALVQTVIALVVAFGLDLRTRRDRRDPRRDGSDPPPSGTWPTCGRHQASPPSS